MIHQQLDPIRIDPDAIYEEGTLRLLLGLTSEVLAKARRSGELQHQRRGRVVFYRGQWVLDWLTGQPTKRRRTAGGDA